MNIISKLLLGLFLLFAGDICYGQIDTTAINSKCDTVTKKTFQKLVHKNYRLMKKSYQFSTKEMVSLIKIFPTLSSDKYFEKNQDFISLFNKKYLADSAEMLEFSPMRGGAMYSKKYNLVIGLSDQITCTSFYSIK